MGTIIKNLFADYGYNVIALPKSNIRPLQFLYKNGKSLSSTEAFLEEFFPPQNVGTPAVTKNVAVAPIIGESEIVLEAKVGISFLKSLLDNLKMSKASANLKLSDNDVITFKFKNITEDSIKLTSLDNYLSETKPSWGTFNTFEKKLKDNELYVINAVLKSSSFSVEIKDKSGVRVDVEASLKGILESGVNINRDKENSIVIAHDNVQEPLVFAFKAQKIIYDSPMFWSKKEGTFKIKDQQDVVLRDESNFSSISYLIADEINDI